MKKVTQLNVEALVSIYTVRGKKIMFSPDLAILYGIDTKVLVQSVRRNLERFPSDFLFKLEYQEVRDLRSQSVTFPNAWLRHPPYAFTQEGVAMLSSILKSPQAIQANVAIMRSFVRMRESSLVHDQLVRKLDKLEKKYDAQFRTVFHALRELIERPTGRKRIKGLDSP